MEDEDGEGKIMDMWSILGDQQLKDSTFGNTLKSSIDNVYTDTIEEEKQIIRYNSVAAKDSPSRNSGAASKVVFKGFKKRILAQAQETQTVPLRNISQEQQLSHPNASPKNNKDKRVETKRGKITEYAQYLGLQPSSKSRCPKCQPFTNFYATNVKQNQCNCNSTMAPMQGLSSTSESSTISHATNFKITRKVYLCAACGTYFENWNLFLHMRDIHKRHICLFCLGMFGQAERLSYHLAKKHGVPEMAFGSVEDFYSAFKGSCYLVCCTCEKVFAETDNFYNHFCSSQTKQDATANLCTLCRQTGSHASTCTFTMESNKEASPVVPVAAAMQTGSITTSVLERPINSSNKGTARRLIKNNRSKYVEDGISNSCQQYVKKASVKSVASSHVNENQTSTDPTIRDGNADDSKIDPDRDTVSETIMEVSKYVEDVCSDEAQQQQQERDVNVSPIRRISEERVVSQTDNPIEQYDSVTQTIMEVSSFTNDKENREDKYDKEDDSLRKDADESDKAKVNNETEIQIEASCKIEDTPESAKVEEEKKEEEDEDEDEDENEDENEGEDEDEEEEEEEEEENEEEEEENEEHEDEEIEDKLNESNTSCQETKDDIKEDKRQDETSLTKFDSESQASPSFVQSPISRSLFSPQHESQQDLQPKEEYPDDGSNKHEEPAPPIESQTSVSFNTVVPSSDRSLIIKICTNRNSQFSVTSTPTNDSSNAPESHEVSKELEENNNAEGSTSEEKISDTSEKEKEDSVNSYRVNDVDSSDSDSDKLAVVDSNAEEAEEAEDAEAAKEFEDKGETKDTVKTDINIREDETEFTISKDASEESKKDEREKLATSEAVVDDTQLPLQSSDGVILAGEDVPIVDFNVEGTLDSMEIEDLLKRCIDAASPFCVYCNHARHIAVNGKQLGLHMLAEHKFQPQHPAIIIQPEQFVVRVKKTLDDLECSCFNLSSYSSTNGTYNVPDVRTYECFHCRFHSAVHKELYLHNRKMHQKTILICIMCKSTFYSYSELLCHLCPGVYSPNINVKYRCCLCPVSNLPSAFRLMVHLRKRHHACDVCLESTGNQQRLSNHVWKHKLHHLCYRCGIAYRNKPDITKHLFWKHGTESVLCKKCLQKKWPHIYHFCIPPTAFVCEECGSSFSRAVALKVHKRLHSGDQPYTCNECSERFISQKLLSKHESVHRESVTVDVSSIETSNNRVVVDDEKSDKDKTTNGDNIAHSSEITKDAKEPVKKVVDVYDLPPLNLSSESDTDAEDEKEETAKEQEKTEKNGTTTTTTTTTTTITTNTNEENAEVEEEDSSSIAGATKVVASPLQATDSVAEEEQNEEDKKQEAQIMDGIWDNFKSYTASLEMQETVTNFSNKETELEIDIAYLRSIVLADHDYCVVWSDKEEKTEVTNNKEDDAIKVNNDGVEYDYSGKAESPSVGGSIVQNTACESDANKKKVKTPKKKKQNGSTSSSDSSSDSDSSSCSCGTNCSCSSSSSGSSSSSSSSSDSDSSASESSPRKSSNRGKERKKERETSQEDKLVEIENKEAPIEVENTINNLLPNEPACHAKLLLRESDLETEETDTDEDFYDEHPQQLANKLLAEKRNQLLLLAAVAPASAESTVPLNNGITDGDCVAPSPDLTATSVEDQPQQKRKIKTKKRKKTERGKQHNVTPIVESLKLNIPKALYQKNPGFSASSPAVITHRQSSRSSTPNFMGNEIHSAIGGGTESQLLMNQSVGGSGSETENKRSSKRKRIPKRFYGDSSDEETDKQPVTKWRKVETPSFASTPNVKHVPPRLSFGGKTVAFRAGHVDSSHVESHVENTTVAAAASGTESEEPEEEPAESSSESSDSDVDMTVQPQAHVTETNTQIPERSVNLYCYCQCPYDEVSEMIACDGEDCHIEWFHFECVGIMVPPKGKWYCPDCRKKHGIVQNSEDYFD